CPAASCPVKPRANTEARASTATGVASCERDARNAEPTRSRMSTGPPRSTCCIALTSSISSAAPARHAVSQTHWATTCGAGAVAALGCTGAGDRDAPPPAPSAGDGCGAAATAGTGWTAVPEDTDGRVLVLPDDPCGGSAKNVCDEPDGGW